jgi:hypothetical protein
VQLEQVVARALDAAAADTDEEQDLVAENVEAFRACDNASMMGGWT